MLFTIVKNGGISQMPNDRPIDKRNAAQVYYSVLKGKEILIHAIMLEEPGRHYAK